MMTDLISRADAIEAVMKHKMPFTIQQEVAREIDALPSAEAAHKPDYSYEADMVRRLKELLSAEAEDRLYIKIYADDEPSVKAEKLYQICGETQNREVAKWLKEYFPSADAVQGEWTPCGEKMPKELERVNITWLNHNPPFYYQHIKDIPQTDTAVYYRGKWYWWDATVIDILAEYGEDSNAEQIDKDIEVLAWMPLPKPYKGGGDE